MAEPTISAGFAKALMDFAISKGADQQTLSARSQINPDELSDQDNRIALSNYMALMMAGADLCNEPALALQFGEAFSMPQLSIVGLIGQSAETVMEAYEQTNRYVRLMIDADEGNNTDWFDMIRDQDGTWMALGSNVYLEYPTLTESAFARCVTEAAPGFEANSFIKAVHFAHGEPDYRAEFDRIFKMPVVFGSDKNALLIDESFMSLKLAPPNRYVFGILSERADALLKELEDAKTTRGRIEVLLMPVLHTGNANVDLVADKLGVSRQTLYRKLKAEGVTFEKILDELRHKLALHYLSGKKVSVTETAYLVGFSDPSAFSRAFKRWTGMSPRTARDENPAE